MEKASLTVEQRSETGKNNVKKLRSQSLIPGNVYGDNENLNVTVNPNLVKRIFNGPFGRNTIIELTVEGDKPAKKDVISYQITKDAVTGEFTHIDFLVVNDSKKVKATVPTKVVGVSPGVKSGGILVQATKAITVKTLPTKIPEFYNIDISTLEVGDIVKAKDVTIGDDSDLLTNPNNLILQVELPRVKKGQDDDVAEEGQTAEAGAEEAGEGEGGE